MVRNGFSSIVALIIIVLIGIVGAASYVITHKTYYVPPPPILASPTPTSPTISSITPSSGATGTRITITGDGFTSNNDIAFSKNTQIENPESNYKIGYINNVSSQDGKTITFELPEAVGVCALSIATDGACVKIALVLSVGQYDLMVVNVNGESNKTTFQII